MASKTERAAVNLAGLVQGIVLVTFPAASTIFTEKSEYGLSSSQYGAMFLHQVVTAIGLGTALAPLLGVSVRLPLRAGPRRPRDKAPRSGQVLVLRGVRRRVRNLRDDERQLVPA
jgi:hypothetical protein